MLFEVKVNAVYEAKVKVVATSLADAQQLAIRSSREQIGAHTVLARTSPQAVWVGDMITQIKYQALVDMGDALYQLEDNPTIKAVYARIRDEAKRNRDAFKVVTSEKA